MTREDGGRDPSPDSTRCHVHRVDEPIGPTGRRCLECNHGFRSHVDLLDEFNRGVYNLNETLYPRVRPMRVLIDGDRVPFCPVCLHDF